MTKEKTLVSEKLAKALFVWIVLHAVAVFMNLPEIGWNGLRLRLPFIVFARYG